MKSTAANLFTVAALVASAQPFRSIALEEPLLEQGLNERFGLFADRPGLYSTLGDETFYLPRPAVSGFIPSYFDVATAGLYAPGAVLVENALEKPAFLPEVGYFPNFEIPAYGMPTFELPAYELPAMDAAAPSSVYVPELASGRNTWVNRLPMKQIYLKPVQLEEQYMYLPEERRDVPVYTPPSWPAPAFPRVYTHERPVIEQLIVPNASQAPTVELIDASYATHVDTPVAADIEVASPVLEQQEGSDEVSERVSAAITPEIADAAAALGLRPRRVWDRETVIDLLGEADELDEAVSGSSAATLADEPDEAASGSSASTTAN